MVDGSEVVRRRMMNTRLRVMLTAAAMRQIGALDEANAGEDVQRQSEMKKRRVMWLKSRKSEGLFPAAARPGSCTEKGLRLPLYTSLHLTHHFHSTLTTPPSASPWLSYSERLPAASWNASTTSLTR